MARYALVTSTAISGRQYYAGDILDEAQEERTIGGLRSAGATLVLLPNPTVEAAAERALALRRSGASIQQIDAIMLGSLANSAETQSTDNPWLEQLVWWISVEDGDDSNDGATEATALKTVAEFNRRFGRLSRVEDGRHYVVNIKAGTYPEGLELSGRFYGDADVTVIGHPRVIATGTIDTFEYPDYYSGANGRPGKLVDSGVSDWASLLGYRVHFDPGGGNESYSFLIHHPTDATTVSCTVGAAVKDRQSGLYGGVAVFPASTPYQVEELPTFLGCDIEARRPYMGAGGANNRDSFIVKHLAFRNPVGNCIVSVTWEGSANFFSASCPLFFACAMSGENYGNASYIGCGWTYPGDGQYGTGCHFRQADVYINGGIAGSGTFEDGCYINQIYGPQGPGAFQFNNPVGFLNGVSCVTAAGMKFGVFCSSSTGAIRTQANCDINFYEVFGENRATSGARAVGFVLQSRCWYYQTPRIKRNATGGSPTLTDVMWGGASQYYTGVDYAGLPAETSLGVEGFDAKLMKLPV